MMSALLTIRSLWLLVVVYDGQGLAGSHRPGLRGREPRAQQTLREPTESAQVAPTGQPTTFGVRGDMARGL